MPRKLKPVGHGGTPLVKKLGLREDMRVVFIADPAHLPALLGPLPKGVTLLSRPGRDMDYVHFFCTSPTKLKTRFPGLVRSLARDGMLWVSWPKKTSALATEVTGDVVRSIGLDGGLVDVKVCAVDDDWSGLKFVRRVKDR